MSNIYATAQLTLAATSSPNSSTGFIQVGSTVDQNHRLLTCLPGRPDEILYVRSTTEGWSTRMYLDQRAWAYQERLLSPRILHFTSHDIIFECNSYTIFEGGKSTDMGNWMGSEEKRLVWQFPGGTFHAPYDRWLAIVRLYPAKALTYPEDRFPALSGIAQFFQRQTKDAYIAGLWRGDMVMGLLWARQHPSYGASPGCRHKEDVFVAPTWSWASKRSVFRIPEPTWRNYLRLQILDVQTKLANKNNPFGQLLSASMVVRGAMRNFSAQNLWNEARGKYHTVSFNDETGALRLRFKMDELRVNPQGDEDVYLLACTTDSALEVEVILASKSSFPHSNVHGLVLERSQDRPEAFERIGIFKVDAVNHGDPTWEYHGFVDTTITVI